MSEHKSRNVNGIEWQYIYFGLLVTGKGEREFIPALFRWIEATGLCHFDVIRKIGQRNPITSPKKSLKMLGSGKSIPNKDEEEIGLPARRYLDKHQDSYVILIDDLEQDRQSIKSEVFNRYRLALDTLLPPETRSRASVQFFVNMLESYYFANTTAINSVFDLKPPIPDHVGNVELIPHPKGDLKKILETKYNIAFDEVRDGKEIISRLDLVHILSNPRHCHALRTLMLWCIDKLRDHPGFIHSDLAQQLDKIQGDLFDPTDTQL